VLNDSYGIESLVAGGGGNAAGGVEQAQVGGSALPALVPTLPEAQDDRAQLVSTPSGWLPATLALSPATPVTLV
jgi:hypothetical protein